MANRAADWMKQALADVGMARTAEQAGRYEWSCFAAQQAAEKALKSLGLGRGLEAWGHSVAGLLFELDPGIEPDGALAEGAKELDQHYIPSRYPNGLPAGTPSELYTRTQAKRAIEHAERIIEWCQSHP
ncbi:MAG TPA: HEPN domain-containing protein [Thermoanaerobaculia bacterium]|nr:HEPN domain-containing protein [Thermoanaerobaculia bacterium]